MHDPDFRLDSTCGEVLGQRCQVLSKGRLSLRGRDERPFAPDLDQPPLGNERAEGLPQSSPGDSEVFCEFRLGFEAGQTPASTRARMTSAI